MRFQFSLGFYNRLFIVPKPNHKWQQILDLSALNRFLKVKTFKMKTPESIRLSLQQGEWVTLLDFNDTYFHIPISPNSRKFIRFHYWTKPFSFGLSFGLLTAAMEFKIVVMEVKLMAQARNICMHQYLDDWLIRAKEKELCFWYTQTLLALCQELGWVVNLKKFRTGTQTDFPLCRRPVDLATRSSQTHSGMVGSPELQNQHTLGEDQLFSDTTRVLDRPAHSNRKAGSV